MQPGCSHQTGSLPPHGFCLFAAVVVIFCQFPCFYLFSYCSHIWFISSNILIFGPSTPKRSIVKWANSFTLHNSAVHRTTFMSVKQSLRETCIALKLAPSCFLYGLCCCFTFFFFKDFPESASVRIQIEQEPCFPLNPCRTLQLDWELPFYKIRNIS